MPKMNNAVLLHGFAGSPERNWLPWLHKELETRGVAVSAPPLPDAFRPDCRKWMNAVAPLAKTWDEKTVVIGHSLGGALALRLLEKAAERRVLGCVLVAAPFAARLPIRQLTSFFETSVDWYHVRRSARSFVIIQAKNDPLVPFDHALRYQESLEGELIMTAKGEHLTKRKAPPVLKALARWL